jgi:hypothetical protein
MIIYQRLSANESHTTYYEEYGECEPLDRARLHSDYEKVPRSNENECFDVCTDDWSCYGFHYSTFDSNCYIWKFKGGLKGSKVTLYD